MPKPDFPMLLPAGIHKLTLNELQSLAVDPFPHDTHRNHIFALFTKWAGEVQVCKTSCTLWIDGSFLTEKVGPGDIDCVAWNPAFTSPPDASCTAKLKRLFDHSVAMTQYNMDLYLEVVSDPQIFHREAYWRGVFGFQHDRKTAKGIVELSI